MRESLSTGPGLAIGNRKKERLTVFPWRGALRFLIVSSRAGSKPEIILLKTAQGLIHKMVFNNKSAVRPGEKTFSLMEKR